MPTELSYFHFLRPAWGLALLPSILLLYTLWRRPPGEQRFTQIIAPHLLAHLRLRARPTAWLQPRAVACLLLLLLALILMGPSWRQQASPLQQDQSALLVLLDASSSMTQRDVQPSRIARARQKVTDLLAMSPDRKTAVIAFAGTAHTVLGLSLDHEIIHHYLSATSPDIMPRRGKRPESALPLIDDMLGDHSGPATILLLSDGPGRDSARAFASYFAQRKHQLLVLGIGSDRVSAAEVPLQREALRSLARRSGGKYLELSIDNTDVTAIDRAIGQHYVPAEDLALPWEDAGYFLLFPAMALLLLWFRRGWTLHWVWLAGLLWLSPAESLQAALPTEQPREASSAPSTQERNSNPLQWFWRLWLSPDQYGRVLLELGHYEQAETQFQDPLWKGIACYYAQNFERAAQYFSRADSELALFNEANARAHARDYLRAAERYQRLLSRQPDYPGARANLARVQALIDANRDQSESQQGDPGERSAALEDNAPLSSEGAETTDWKAAAAQEQLSAEDILTSQAQRDMWLRGVQKDPAGFLASKFSVQASTREAESRSSPGTEP